MKQARDEMAKVQKAKDDLEADRAKSVPPTAKKEEAPKLETKKETPKGS